MIIFKNGFIDKVVNSGDSGNPYVQYIVSIPEEQIVTGPLFQFKRNTLKNQDDYPYDIGEPVGCLLTDDFRTGYILGAINNANTPNKVTDQDIEQKTFSDGTTIAYDRKNHIYKLNVSGGKINLNADSDITVASKTKVIINTGSNGGIPIESIIEENFEALDAKVEIIKDGVTAGFTAMGSMQGDAAALAYEAATAGAVFNVTDMKDQKATH